MSDPLREIDRAFYDLVVKERDYERVKCDRMERERDTLKRWNLELAAENDELLHRLGES